MILGSHAVFVKGRRFNADCVGVVLGIYYYAGMDLSTTFRRYKGNGVARLFKASQAAGLLYDTDCPACGDLIFWDNTWDRNGDGQWNDWLTHVGMVVDVGRDGTIDYVHYHYKNGVVMGKMNLVHKNDIRHPSGGKNTLINTPMRMRSSGKGDLDRWLSSHLYRAFGKAYLMDMQ